MKYDVPFVGNTEDDLHCFQAAYLMILRYFRPETEMQWDRWCEITGYEEGKGTWASAGLLWFKNNGFEVKHISLFNYEDFAEHGGDYLIRLTGPEVGQWQIKHTNMPSEQAKAKELLKTDIVEMREPTQEDIKRFLDEGWLVRCLVNSSKLNERKGYVGHSIVVIGYDNDGFIIHDPGLPPLENRHVGYELFESAWADPGPGNKELDAIRMA